jgi:hypothetical protein
MAALTQLGLFGGSAIRYGAGSFAGRGAGSDSSVAEADRPSGGRFTRMGLYGGSMRRYSSFARVEPEVPLQIDYVDEQWRIVETTPVVSETWRRILTRP